MDFGADANAHTDFFNTVYDLSLPKGDREHLSNAFVIIQDYAQGALVLETEVNRERGIISAEKRERDSVSYRTFKKTLEFELPESLFNQRFPIGVDRVIKLADRRLLKAYYDKWYRPDNMVLIVVGDFDIKTIQPLIIKRFSNLKPRTLSLNSHVSTKWEDHSGIKTFYHHEPEAGNTEVTVETVSWQPFQAQTLDLLKVKTLNQIANLLLKNRLSRMVSKQKAGFSEATAYSGSFLHNISLSAIRATCDPDKWEKTLQQVENTLRQGLLYGFSEKELDRVKSDFISFLEIQNNQAASQRTSDLSRKILTAINQKELLLSPKQRKDLLEPYIKSISLQDVQNALKKLWSKDHRLVLVTGNAVLNSKESEKIILDIYQKSQGDVIEPYQGFESRPFPYLELPTSSASIRTRKDNVKDLGITTIDFQNNVRLNLKKTDYKHNEFLFKVCFGEGKKNEPISKPGLSFVSEGVLRDSGLGELDADQLEDALAGNKVRIDFGIHENYFSLSGASDPKEAELVFQLINHYFIDPGYRLDALNLVKTRYQQEYDSLIRMPDGIMQIKGVSFLAKNDSRFGLPNPATINPYTLEDIKNWMTPVFKNSSVEISVVGDFNLEHMIHLASKHIGALQQRPGFVVNRMDQGNIEFPKGEMLELKIQTKIDMGVVHVAFLTDDFWDIMQTRRLSVLSKIIAERLRIVIREELAETYSPYVYNDPSMRFNGYGILHIVVNVKPEKLEFVYDKIKEIVHSLTIKEISEEETKLVLKPFLNHLDVFRKTNTYWLTSVMADSTKYPQKLNWAKNLIADYNTITNDELIKLSKKYLKIERSARILIKPEE